MSKVLWWMAAQQIELFRYFDDPDVLDRVPGMFLLLGGVFLIMGLTGTALMSLPSLKQSRALVSITEKNKENKKSREKDTVNLKFDNILGKTWKIEEITYLQ